MLKPIFFMHSLCASMCVLQFSSPCSIMLQLIKPWFKSFPLLQFSSSDKEEVISRL